MESKYTNGKIYSIRSYQTDMIYIGSTCQLLSQRLAKHRNNYKQYLLGKYHYVSSYKLLEYDDYYIELIEEYPCDNKSLLNRREGEIIRQTENCINKVVPGRTDKEYRTDNKEKILNINKQYRENNKDKIFNCNKQYRENNKDKIKEHRTQPYTCECGKTIQFDKKARHCRSAYHLNHIKISNV